MQHFIFYMQNYFIIYIPTCMYYENSKYLTSFLSLPKKKCKRKIIRNYTKPQATNIIESKETMANLLFKFSNQQQFKMLL